MDKYKLIPQVVERILALMAKLKIKPLDPKNTPIKSVLGHARFYMAPVIRTGGQIVWFKTSLRDSVWLRRGLREETRVQQAFAEYEHRHHPHFDSPSYLDGGDDGHGGLWLMRKYWQGTYAGDMDTSFGLTDGFLNRVGPKQMAAVMNDVRQMTSFLKRRLSLDRHGLDWYLLDFHYYRRHFFGPLLRHQLNPGWRRSDVDKMEKSLLIHRSFFRHHTNTFTHGDMYPNNIMVRSSQRPVVLFDWELSHLNLPTFDPVMVYLQAWRQPRWQAAFRAETMRLIGESAASQTAWNLAMLSLATRLTAFCFLRLTNGQPGRYSPLLKRFRPTIQTMFKRNLVLLQQVFNEFVL